MNAEEIALELNARKCDLLKGTKLIESYAKQRAVEFGRLVQLKEFNNEWEPGKTWEDYYDTFIKEHDL